MNRLRVGIGILLLMLILSIGITVLMHRVHPPMAALLSTAALEAEAGNWPAAREAAQEATQIWAGTRTLTAIFADHSPMDDIDGLFAELQTYIRMEETPHFAATCRQLARLVQSMGENHAFAWWNLF